MGQDGGRPRSVEVDNLPFAVPAVPDAGLLRLGGAGDAAGVQVLRDADVGYAGRLVAHQVDVGVQDGGVHRFAVPGPQVFKIESMEVQALDQVPQGLRFKGRHPGVTHLPGGRKSEERGAGVASWNHPLIQGPGPEEGEPVKLNDCTRLRISEVAEWGAACKLHSVWHRCLVGAI